MLLSTVRMVVRYMLTRAACVYVNMLDFLKFVQTCVTRTVRGIVHCVYHNVVQIILLSLC